MDKKIIYWGTCYATVGPPTDDYLLWFFSDGQVLRANRAYPHKQELEAQGYTLIEVILVENASQDWPRLEHNFTFNEGKKGFCFVLGKSRRWKLLQTFQRNFRENHRVAI